MGQSFAVKVRMVSVTAFLRPDNVRSAFAFEELKEDLPVEAEDFVLYFQETFIGRFEAGASSQSGLHLRCPPLPPPPVPVLLPSVVCS